MVAFDGAPLGDGPPTGVARAFLDALAAYARDPPGRLALLLPDRVEPPPLPGVDIVRAPRGALRRQLGLPRLLRRIGADLLHSPVAAVPLAAPCPTIATVHDLPWLHPEARERTGPWRRFATRRSLRAASAVLAPSRFTLAAVERWLGPSRRQRRLCVPHGTVPPDLPPPPPAQRQGPLLALGDDRPRKNRALVRRAFALARSRCRELPELRFVGPPEAWVPEPDKRALLRSCRALVQGSRFEGFGLPVLEGLAHGAPVLCSDLPPFREVAGDAALFAGPDDAEGFAKGLVRIHTDAGLREQLAAAGPERAARFRPEACASAWNRLHGELLL